MYRYKCDKCGGNCDAGELTAGICPECLEEERVAKSSQEKAAILIRSPFEQLNLEVYDKKVMPTW